MRSADQLCPAALPKLSSVVVAPSIVGAGVTKDGGAVLIKEGAGRDVLRSDEAGSGAVAVPSENTWDGGAETVSVGGD